jgi:hypothetical protein
MYKPFLVVCIVLARSDHYYCFKKFWFFIVEPSVKAVPSVRGTGLNGKSRNLNARIEVEQGAVLGRIAGPVEFRDITPDEPADVAPPDKYHHPLSGWAWACQ